MTRFHKKSAAAIGGVALLLIRAPAGALDFKGIQLGGPATPKEIEQKFAPQPNSFESKTFPRWLWVKCGAGAEGWQVCNGETTVADIPGRLNLVIDARGLVQQISITFPSSGFEQVKNALIDKFGMPSRQTHRQVENKMGATFESEILVWRDSSANEAIIGQYAVDLDTSMLLFVTKFERDHEDRVQKKLDKKHSGDM